MSDPVAADYTANSTDASIGIVVSEWQPEISNALLEQALQKLEQCGVMREDIYISHVPGAMELPFGARQMNNMMEPSAVIMIGSVVRENNPHYDIICQTLSRSITHLNLHGDIPFIFGVVTTENIEQAIERAGTKAGNKGSDSAMAAMEMANLLKKIG
jgi:6,7-dimethyl-8-ribityllumazine synthase